MFFNVSLLISNVVPSHLKSVTHSAHLLFFSISFLIAEDRQQSKYITEEWRQFFLPMFCIASFLLVLFNVWPLNWQDVHHWSFLKTAISSQKNGSQAFKTDLYLSLNQTVIFALFASVIKSGQAVILQVTSYNLGFHRTSLRVNAASLCNYNSCI